jgi:hypothetical protein
MKGTTSTVGATTQAVAIVDDQPTRVSSSLNGGSREESSLSEEQLVGNILLYELSDDDNHQNKLYTGCNVKCILSEGSADVTTPLCTMRLC